MFHNIRIDISPRIQNTFEIQPLRWKVERTFSWFQGSRRLSKDYEIKAVHAETMCRLYEKKSVKIERTVVK